MRYDEIECRAENVLIEAKVNAPAVKADEIAEFVFDLNFEWKKLDERSPSSEILAAISFGDKKIYMNESCASELNDNRGRMNFTIAHELGHWVLHRDSAQAQLPGFDGKVLVCRGVKQKTNSKEREANLFATYLLMPKRFIEASLRAFDSPLTENDIKQTADEFRVSKQTMRIRLVNELKLLHCAEGLYYKSKLEVLELGGQQRLF